ncbi:ParA family protein [Lacihabitans soyangensis]|uniref:ParA family protein n=1 Tax=Lacihabitans soyangensis TaxID=869394 RepID=A0AAE3H3N5_9BACT|nr:ParA family protein [Lacihabitans soyangensis]MCP9762315.1 ParA family protein [Lacihabitans soyangensis]
MKIITVAHQMGGVVKTTLTLNLAASLKNGGLKVALLDIDLQGSLAGISDELEDIAFIQPDELSNIGTLPYDVLIIDTPPYLINSLNDLFAISDYVLIPSKVGFFDVMAIRATLAIIREAQKSRPDLKYGVVLNMLKSCTSITDDIRYILESYEAYVLKTVILERVSYTRSSITNGVFSTEDVKAHHEIIARTNEILDELNAQERQLQKHNITPINLKGLQIRLKLKKQKYLCKRLFQ